MKIPFHIHVQLSIDYNMPDEKRLHVRDAVLNLLRGMGCEIVGDAAGPYRYDKE